jgi:hypothetical protein
MARADRLAMCGIRHAKPTEAYLLQNLSRSCIVVKVQGLENYLLCAVVHRPGSDTHVLGVFFAALPDTTTRVISS